MSTTSFTSLELVDQAAARPTRSRLRITTRGRAVLAALAAMPLVVAAVILALNGGTASAANESSFSRFDYVQVTSGQSLWQLAEVIAPESDPRDVISEIVHLNQLASPDVQPGQQLAVPAQYNE